MRQKLLGGRPFGEAEGHLALLIYLRIERFAVENRRYGGLEEPAADTVSWWAWRAWALLMGLRGVDRAITHKPRHRKALSLV